MASSRDLLNFQAAIAAFEKLNKKDDPNFDVSTFNEFRKQLKQDTEMKISAPMLNTNPAFVTYNNLCDRIAEINWQKF